MGAPGSGDAGARSAAASDPKPMAGLGSASGLRAKPPLQPDWSRYSAGGAPKEPVRGDGRRKRRGGAAGSAMHDPLELPSSQRERSWVEGAHHWWVPLCSCHAQVLELKPSQHNCSQVEEPFAADCVCSCLAHCAMLDCYSRVQATGPLHVWARSP